ncbi:hypothetical protein EW026_g5140 [Hermanssonia centrifuga]|uniref:Uncharacterized protein n=1 Tax=Hermanssonia centrifuga TaxID=98765 RepID=A0A4S4KEZ3_9APHY|nr:hypothetical protein EW026_g5140 [Hermanssonia centrifuga]
MSLPSFSGTLRKLVMAFDVGTTYSGIGYAILDPGEVPRIQGVTRFPGQENGDFKIPTILWYTQEGTVRAAGAEARDPGMTLLAEDEDLIFVEWFKLHLRPNALQDQELKDSKLQPLPLGKTVIDVFGDFLKYLFQCAKQFIVETHPNGSSLWSSVDQRIEFVLSHPNGWEGLQQGKMREAAVAAGLIPNNAAGQARLHFVTEGEASMHYCVDSGLTTGTIQDGQGIMIVDAGGGTVDLSTYLFTSTTPTTVEEIAPPDCILQGSTRVNVRAERFLRAKLGNSRYGNEEDIKTMLESFEKSAKPTFKEINDRSFIKFGSMRDRDPDVGIRSGQLTIDGTDVAKFFEPSIQAILESVRKQRQLSSTAPEMAFLVGGFAASPWLFARLKTVLASIGMELSRPDNHTNKAVAEGAVSHYLQHFVSVRVARLTYGAACCVDFDGADNDHSLRAGNIFYLPSGRLMVPDAFRVIIEKGTRMQENEEVEYSFQQETSQKSVLNSLTAPWSVIGAESRDQSGPTSKRGIEKRGPAEIVYDNDASAVC